MLLALVAFLVPVFEKIFKDFGGELPAITKFTVTLSHIVTGQLVHRCSAVVVGIVVGFKKWKNSERGRDAVGPLQAALPVKIGDIVQKVALARWSRTFSALDRRRRADAAGDRDHRPDRRQQASSRTRWTTSRESVKSGGSIAAPMRERARCFPAMVAQMIAVGEETGDLDTMLSKVADFYEDEVAAAVKALTSILEPIMIILVGGIVGFIVIAMYMPMFKVYDQIR